MKTEMGEFLVGAYMREVLTCDFVGYNVRPPGGGLEGLAELDVVGLKFDDRIAYLCEVTTHLDGLQYGTYATTIQRVKDKFKRQQAYARKHLPQFKKVHYMFWSPVVRVGALTKALAQIDGLQFVINEAYTACVRELEAKAKETTRDTGNPFFRGLQIMAHLRKTGP